MTPLSEQEALRILMQPMPPDRFAILNRRGRRLTDTQIVEILREPDDRRRLSSPPPIPTARVAHVPARPLSYLRPLCDRARFAEMPLAALPLSYRILRVTIWLFVAVAMIVVMIKSL